MSNQNTPSRTPMVVMVVGGLLVAGLVGWALTRSVEPAAPPPSAPYASPSTVGVTRTPSTTTAPLSPESYSLGSGHPQEPDKAEVARISVEDLKAKYDRGEVTVIDVRDVKSYEAGHIAGSLSVPMPTVQAQVDSLPKGKTIVAYCT